MDINTLVAQLTIARDMYYSGTPIMADATFDALEKQLRDLDPSNQYFSTVGTPAVRGVKVRHKFPMGSLDQFDEDQEISKWVRVTKSNQFVLSAKLDGNSIVLEYDQDGYFRSACTRGDGVEGLDITRHIKRIFATNRTVIPRQMTPNAIVRAEAIIKPSIFDAMNTDKQYKNARNYVAGQLNRTVAEQQFIDNVDIIAFDSNIDGNKIAMLAELRRWFDVPRHQVVDAQSVTSANLEALLNDLKHSYPWEVDGVVVDVDDQQIRQQMGFKDLNPEYSRKFKINVSFLDTEVNQVHWAISKDGYLKPRVEIEPVELDGVTITFATGFNAKFIASNRCGPGAKVRITRSGQVIPFIVAVTEPSELVLDAYMPSVDQYGEMHWTESGVDLVTSTLGDQSTILQMVDFFSGIDAPMLKRGNITALYDAGYTSIADIILADENELTTVLGENGTKVYVGLRDKLSDIEQWKFAGSLPFFGRGVGTKKIRKIFDIHGSLRDLTESEIAAIDGFDTKTAAKVYAGIKPYLEFLDSVSGFVSFKRHTHVDGDLNGVVVCFTGIRSRELELIIESRGGKVATSVTKETTHLVAKSVNGSSSKLTKARAAGIEILDMEQAENLWKK